MSRVGNKIHPAPGQSQPQGLRTATVEVEGPKGKLDWTLPEGISLSETTALSPSAASRVRLAPAARSMHGTARSLIANMVEGVSAGFTKKLEIHGVGFRAAVKGKTSSTSTSGSPTRCCTRSRTRSR